MHRSDEIPADNIMIDLSSRQDFPISRRFKYIDDDDDYEHPVSLRQRREGQHRRKNNGEKSGRKQGIRKTYLI